MERLLLRPSRRLPKARPILLGSIGWPCAPGRRHQSSFGPLSPHLTFPSSGSAPEAESNNKKPYYVTTPIFYVNAAPHIGHLYSMCIADALKRWHVIKGRKSYLLTGVDEHGMKVQKAAAANDVPPQEWCDVQSQKFRQLAEAANISHDFFVRTTDEAHKDAVRHFWHLLQHSGLIYEAEHQGWYCVSDETFLPESQTAVIQDPITGKVSRVSIDTGNEVEWVQEKTYHFRLTAMKDRLLEFYRENPDWITPKHQMKDVVNWVENHLTDLSISRPTSRLNWGVRVPDDESHTIYVWVDALVNYLTKAGFPNWTPGKESEGGWPADCHVIGKDITRFHGVYWPAMLLAADLPLPKRIISHAHWTMDGKKMSKSLGNVVNPFYAIDRWGVDTVRWFMLGDGKIDDDTDYDNEIIEHRYKKTLQGSIGNMLGRVTRSKNWHVRDSVEMGVSWVRIWEAGVTSPVDLANGTDDAKSCKVQIEILRQRIEQAMTEGQIRGAIIRVQKMVALTNESFTAAEPWALAKLAASAETSEEAEKLKQQITLCCFLAAERLRHIGIYLQPIMPEKARQMLDVLGVDEERRTLEWVGLAKDDSYGVPLRDIGNTSHDSLFPPLEVEERPQRTLSVGGKQDAKQKNKKQDAKFGKGHSKRQIPESINSDGPIISKVPQEQKVFRFQ